MSETPLATAAGAPGRILVVDDLEVNRRLLVRRTVRLGYQVEEAATGPEALEQLAVGGHDVVLLDVMMPGMTGYEVLERIKRDPALASTRVIMVSAVDEVDSVVRCIDLGADDYLPKPFNPVLLAARLASSLARKQLLDAEQAHARALERELELGREIQAGFFPPELPAPEGWELVAAFQSARQVAGDFYDVFELDDRTLGLVVGDVCDKGVGAALYMALFRSLLRSRAVDIGGPPGEVLQRSMPYVSDYIATTHGDANMFATVFFAVLDLETGALGYVNAGHDPPAVRRVDGRVEVLDGTGPALGLVPGLSFRQGHTILAPGEWLLAYTDGVTEARAPDETFFGEDRLLRLLQRPDGRLTTTLELVLDALATHRAHAPISDDVTLLGVSRAGIAGVGGAAPLDD